MGGLLGVLGILQRSECGIFYALFWRLEVDGLIFGGFSGFVQVFGLIWATLGDFS